MDSCTLTSFGLPIVQSLIAGYALLFLTKVYSYIRIRKFLGPYSEIPTTGSNVQYLKELRFAVSYNWLNLFTPVLHTSINVSRKNVVKSNDSMDWSGVYHSDILNPFYFRGIYIITNPGPHDSHGWHEMLCFNYKSIEGKQTIRIALRVNYIDTRTRQWVSNGGYYIEKNNS